MKIITHNGTLPADLLKALDIKNTRLHYTDARAVYQFVWMFGESFCGVFGDGENGAYEWFIWREGTLETSDCAYGSVAVALRDVLLQTEGYPDAVRHANS
jgi:hypothetical protein